MKVGTAVHTSVGLADDGTRLGVNVKVGVHVGTSEGAAVGVRVGTNVMSAAAADQTRPSYSGGVPRGMGG